MSGVTIIVAYGSVEIGQALAHVQRNAPGTLMVGITRYPRGACWLVGLAWQHTPLIWVSAHRLKATAEAQRALVGQVVAQDAASEDAAFARLHRAPAAQSDPDLAGALDQASVLPLPSA